jgi:feruloyl esterase
MWWLVVGGWSFVGGNEMRLRTVRSGGVAVAALIALLAAAGPVSAATCESLASLTLPNATISMAQPVAAGAFTPPAGRGGRGGGAAFSDLPAFCRVAATLTPTKESDIKTEIWLPASGWNGKFEVVGNGGWNGAIDANALAAGVRRGYATAATDLGHQGNGGPWMQNPEKLADYGHRAVHETTVKGKAIVAAFYERGPRLSYFNGCSAGGRQGLIAAQRYPDDFDGIVAGAPALNATGRASFAMWVAQNVHKDEGALIPQAKFAAINDAVLQACDALDGVTGRSRTRRRAGSIRRCWRARPGTPPPA